MSNTPEYQGYTAPQVSTGAPFDGPVDPVKLAKLALVPALAIVAIIYVVKQRRR